MRDCVGQVAMLRQGMHTVISAMEDHGVRRIVSLSGAAIDAGKTQGRDHPWG